MTEEWEEKGCELGVQTLENDMEELLDGYDTEA